MNDGRCGVMYVAFGYEYLVMALYSLASLKRIHPEVKTALLTNIALKKDSGAAPFFDTVIHVDAGDKENRLYKTRLYEYSPFERTLFLDCDTLVKGNVSKGFVFLNRFDIALRLHHYPIVTNLGDIHLDIDTDYFPHWNSGVLFFKKAAKVEEFFKKWHETYKQFSYARDQFALVHSLYYSDVRILSLDLSWNAGQDILSRDKKIQRNIKVFHYRKDLRMIRNLRSFERDVACRVIDCPQKESLRALFNRKYSDLRRFKAWAKKKLQQWKAGTA